MASDSGPDFGRNSSLAHSARAWPPRLPAVKTLSYVISAELRQP